MTTEKKQSIMCEASYHYNLWRHDIFLFQKLQNFEGATLYHTTAPVSTQMHHPKNESHNKKKLTATTWNINLKNV